MTLIFDTQTEAEDCLIALHKAMRPWAKLSKTDCERWSVTCDC